MALARVGATRFWALRALAWLLRAMSSVRVTVDGTEWEMWVDPQFGPWWSCRADGTWFFQNVQGWRVEGTEWEKFVDPGGRLWWSSRRDPDSTWFYEDEKDPDVLTALDGVPRSGPTVIEDAAASGRCRFATADPRATSRDELGWPGAEVVSEIDAAVAACVSCDVLSGLQDVVALGDAPLRKQLSHYGMVEVRSQTAQRCNLLTFRDRQTVLGKAARRKWLSTQPTVFVDAGNWHYAEIVRMLTRRCGYVPPCLTDLNREHVADCLEAALAYWRDHSSLHRDKVRLRSLGALADLLLEEEWAASAKLRIGHF